MKLDRNAGGQGKYSVINNRKLAALSGPNAKAAAAAFALLRSVGVLHDGTDPEFEYFVMMLKDRYSGAGLQGYAAAAVDAGDTVYGHEVSDLARRAGSNSPFCKRPD